MFVLSRGMEFVFPAMDRSEDDDDDDDVEMLSTIAWFDRRRYCSFDEWGRGYRETRFLHYTEGTIERIRDVIFFLDWIRFFLLRMSMDFKDKSGNR